MTDPGRPTGPEQGPGFGAGLGAGFQEQLAEVTGELRAHRDRLLAAQREVAAQTTTVRSKDRTVSVTVGPGGDVRDIRFHTDAYRDMAPAELGKALVAVIEQARTRASAKARDVFEPLRGAGGRMRRSMTGGTALEEMLRPLREMDPGRARPGAADEEE